MKKVRKNGVHIRFEYVDYLGPIVKRVLRRLCDLGIQKPNCEDIEEALLFLSPELYKNDKYKLTFSASIFYNEILDKVSFIKE